MAQTAPASAGLDSSSELKEDGQRETSETTAAALSPSCSSSSSEISSSAPGPRTATMEACFKAFDKDRYGDIKVDTRKAFSVIIFIDPKQVFHAGSNSASVTSPV